MTWADPPTKVVEARDAIVACAAAVTLGCGSTPAYHYPEAGLKTTTMPFCVLSEAEYTAERHAPGESYARGSISATFYLDPAVTSIGTAEEAGHDLVLQLSELTGESLFIAGATRSLCSRVRRSKVAASADGAARSYFTLQIQIAWEG
jgi:hypothetical protein